MHISIDTSVDPDYIAWLDIFSRARSSVTGFSGNPILLDGFKSSMEGETVHVAKVKDRVVGFISVWEPDNFIHHLYVDPDFQRCGIGAALLQVCIDRVGFPVSLKCIEANKRARQFYERSGFVAIDKAVGPEGSYILYKRYE